MKKTLVKCQRPLNLQSYTDDVILQNNNTPNIKTDIKIYCKIQRKLTFAQS